MPISSTSTSERSLTSLSIDFKLSMCAENVERSAAMDCSSPISASTRSKIPSRADCAATGMPDCAASTARPTVFSATVLPPVFGPLMTSTVSAFVPSAVEGPPISSVSGTMARPCRRSPLSSTGCRTASSAIAVSCVNTGMHASYSRAKRARANSESNSAIGIRRLLQRRALGGHASGQFLENARDLGGFFFGKLHQAIVQLDGFERLEEHRLPGGARRMHHALHAAPFRELSRESRSDRCAA